MTDPTTPPAAPAQPSKPPAIVGILVTLAAWLKRNLAPNRVVLYLTAAADVLAAVLVVADDLNLTQVAGVIGVLAALTAKALSFVKGQQNMEQALYQRDLIAFNASAQADAAQRAAQAAQAVGKPGTGPRLNLPR